MNNEIIELFNESIKILRLDTNVHAKLKKNKLKLIKNLIYAGYDQIKQTEGITINELARITKELKNLGIDIKDKEQCQELIDEYKEKQENKEIVKIQIDEMDLSTRLYNSLLRSGHITILDIIYDNNIKNIRQLGTEGYVELKEKLYEYGIDYDNRIQRENLIKKFNENCFKNGIVMQLEKTIDDMKDEYYIKLYNPEKIFNKFKNQECKILLDVIINREIFQNEYALIRKYGIDIKNEKQCKKIIRQYEKEKQAKPIIKNEFESQELRQITDENETLENELARKKIILKKINEQKNRRELLMDQLAECDREFFDLIEKYKALDSKERGKIYGKK